MGTKTLTTESFDAASEFVLHSARALERNTYNHVFNDDDSVKSLLELKNYQNPDGGFGHGLEPDLRLPFSSPISTTVAFQHIERLGKDSEVGRDLIESGINYLESSFQPEHNRWFAASPEINNFPHAPWWHYNEKKGRTPVDEFWGNPTAEILAYGLKYKGFSNAIDTEELVTAAIRKINERKKFESEHEVYCYLKLYRNLPSGAAKDVEKQLTKAVEQLVCRDPDQWNSQAPQPLDFVPGPEAPRFGLSETMLEKNLDFLVDSIVENETIRPSWEWGQFESEWERAELEWTGILTLKTLITLDRFDRIS